MAIVETHYGKLEGATNNGIHSFKGIPFAAPPIGEKRWSTPEPPTPWAGVRAANGDWGKQAWQQISDNPDGALTFIFNARNAAYRDEDCLQLNVWTRGLDDSKRAVMVWIHGGSFSGGTGGTPVYDGTLLAERCDVVVVTINYRLGAFGWLNLNELTDGRIPSTGNEGLLDQVEALKWVRDNISAFGGDPENVTIFGQSAGGMCVGAHLAFEASKGLFHRAIPISGAASTAYPISRAVETTEALLDRIGISGKADPEELFALDPEVITNASAGLQLPGGGMTFQPIIDGINLKEMPIEAVKKGSADGIPILVGSTRDEFLGFRRNNPNLAALDEVGLIAEISKTVRGASDLVAGYREIREARGAATDPAAIVAAIETDRKLRMPAIALAETMAARDQSAYHYIFSWESPWDGGINGSPHAIDIGFVFGMHDFSEASAKFFGQGEAADTVSVNLQDAFVQLAKTSNPRTEALSDLVAYDTETRSTIIFDAPVEVKSAPFEGERLLWVGKEASLPFGPEL
jgi:para-nitrobenzyl esterase